MCANQDLKPEPSQREVGGTYERGDGVGGDVGGEQDRRAEVENVVDEGGAKAGICGHEWR